MSGPAIVQSDRSVLLEVAHAGFDAARAELARFAELEKSPEHVHTYRITAVSLWNAAAAGMPAGEISSTLEAISRYPVPQAVLADVRDLCGRYGRLRLACGDREGSLVLVADDPALLVEVSRSPTVAGLLGRRLDASRVAVAGAGRGALKQALVEIGWPVRDEAPFADGASLTVGLADGVELRGYQVDADAALTAAGAGVVVLPCGAGKTLVGLAAIARLECEALIVTSNQASVEQWQRELLDKTTLTAAEVGEYTGRRKELRPITVTTYQLLTSRPSRTGGFRHLDLFERREWGLVIYDEVHLLPAPIFRATARIQARRRLGLTATLIREDGAEPLVFTLVGPKCYDTAWRELEDAGWLAGAECAEVRVPFADDDARMAYALAEPRERFRLASTNASKGPIVRALLDRHRGRQALVMATYVGQLKVLAAELGAPIVTGRTPLAERTQLYDRFRAGEIPVLCVSKVANFALDLPSAGVAIEVSGSFGSRQEEAQRLGRLLRPKPGDNRAWFYSLVTRDTAEQDAAHRRQRFLAEQGYRYTVLGDDDIVPELAAAA
jgi:DNA excision repair protein ERCC-3